MRILVTGAGGMLGHDVLAEIDGRGHTAIAADRASLDVRDQSAVGRFLSTHRPDAVVHCASYTQVDRAESERDTAFAVNADSARYVADACAATGAWMILVSTDFVFSGEKGSAYIESDPICPLSVYGASKAEGEKMVRDSLPDRHMIARTAYLYGPHGANLVKSIVRFARTRDSLSFVTDQIVSPTHTVDVARSLIDLAEAPAAGTYHTASTGECSLFEFAGATLAAAGLSTPVLPTTFAEYIARYQPPARRPRISPLKSEYLRRIGLPELPHWRDALLTYLSRPGSGAREE